MGLTGTAIREGRPVISNDISSDPRMESCRSGAARRGYRSSAAFPLVCSGHAIGAMRFYSGEVNFFNDREIRLLEELVTDIYFALDLIENGGKPSQDNRQRDGSTGICRQGT
jgi:GAF domain-containing protein